MHIHIYICVCVCVCVGAIGRRQRARRTRPKLAGTTFNNMLCVVHVVAVVVAAVVGDSDDVDMAGASQQKGFREWMNTCGNVKFRKSM